LTRSSRRSRRRRELSEQRAAISRSAAESVNASTRALFCPVRYEVAQCKCASNYCWDCQLSAGFSGRAICASCGGIRDRLAYLVGPCIECHSEVQSAQFARDYGSFNAAVAPGLPPGYKIADNVPTGYRGVFEKPDPCP
jgi:hypothetical protein